jgi:hypothetical protein
MGAQYSGLSLRYLPRLEWEFMEENLRRFGQALFVRFGEALRRFGRDGTNNSRLISESALGGWVSPFREASRPSPPLAWPRSPGMNVLER